MVEGFANAADEIPAQGTQVSLRSGRHATRDPGRAPSARWAWPAALAGAAVILFLLYLRLSGTVPDNSDASDQALQAWDMLHGNLLLHGWTVGDVSYYTTEIPEYMLVELIKGLGAGVVHVSAAVSYTLLVLLAGVAGQGAGHRARGRAARADSVRHPARPAAWPRRSPADPAAGPPRHPGPAAGHLHRDRSRAVLARGDDPPVPRAGTLVRPRRRHGDAGLGHRRRPGGGARRGHPAGYRVRPARLLGVRARRQAAGLAALRAVPRRGGDRLVRGVRRRDPRDRASGRVRRARRCPRSMRPWPRSRPTSA